MTHTTVSSTRESFGSTTVEYHTIDITSLDSAGAEAYDPDAETGVNTTNTGGVSVVGQETADYLVRWDHAASELAVVNLSDGSDVASGTDVGEVRLQVVGV